MSIYLCCGNLNTFQRLLFLRLKGRHGMGSIVADGAQVDSRDSHNIMKYMNCTGDGGDLEQRVWCPPTHACHNLSKLKLVSHQAPGSQFTGEY